MTTAHDLKLTYRDLAATQLIVSSRGYSLKGDGTVIFKNKDGGIRIMDVHFSDNAPDYPSYIAYGMMQNYLDQFKNQTKTMDFYTSHATSFPKTFMGVQYIKPFDYFQTSYETNMDRIEWIMGFSDGLHSFVKDGNMAGSTYDIISLLMVAIFFKFGLCEQLMC